MEQSPSIWEVAITDNLDRLFSAVISADQDGFEKAAEPFSDALMSVGAHDLEAAIAGSIAKIEALELPGEMKREMIDSIQAGLEADFDDEDEDDDWSDDDDPFEEDEDPTFEMPSRREIHLATSHMFFDDPYASMDYEEIERQVQNAMQQYRGAISRIIGNPGESFAAHIGVSGAELENDENFDLLERFCAGGFEWVWTGGDNVFFLVHDHEDKELPIHLSFGRAARDEFAALRDHIREAR